MMTSTRKKQQHKRNNFSTAIYIFLMSFSLNQVSCDSQERKLIESLFKDYDYQVRPVRNNGTPIDVEVDYWFISLLDIQEKSQSMSAFGWMQMVWRDEFIVWNMTQYNLTYVVVNAKDIWYPDLIIRNSADSVYGDIFDNNKYRVPIYSDGSVYFYTAGQTKTFCLLNTFYFPFDNQTCFFQVDSWTYTNTQVTLNTTDGIKMNLYNNNGQWIYEGNSFKVCHESFNGDVYDNIKFFFFIKRKPLYYLTNLIIPCCLMSVIVLFVFLLPASADEKVSLSITVLLSFSVFQLLVAGNMPETSEYVPLITMYITFVMILSSMSLFCTIIVLMIHHHDTQTPPPKWLQKFALEWFVFLLCTKSKLVPCRKKKKTEENSNEVILKKLEVDCGIPNKSMVIDSEKSIEIIEKCTAELEVRNALRRISNFTEGQLGVEGPAFSGNVANGSATKLDVENIKNIFDKNHLGVSSHHNISPGNNADVSWGVENYSAGLYGPDRISNNNIPKDVNTQNNYVINISVNSNKFEDDNNNNSDEKADRNVKETYSKESSAENHQNASLPTHSTTATNSGERGLNQINTDQTVDHFEFQTSVDTEPTTNSRNGSFSERNYKEKRNLYSSTKSNEVNQELNYSCDANNNYIAGSLNNVFIKGGGNRCSGSFSKTSSNNNDSNKKTSEHKSSDRNETDTIKAQHTSSKFRQKFHQHNKTDFFKSTISQLSDSERNEKMQMSSIFQLVTASLARINSEKRSEEIKKQWTNIAMVIDRLFLVIFTLVTVVVAVVLLGLYPQLGPKELRDVTCESDYKRKH